ncbi:MAG: hypothetical protein WCI05_14895 [Myxococcales bacterium]
MRLSLSGTRSLSPAEAHGRAQETHGHAREAYRRAREAYRRAREAYRRVRELPTRVTEGIFPLVSRLPWNRVAHGRASKALFVASKLLSMASEGLGARRRLPRPRRHPSRALAEDLTFTASPSPSMRRGLLRTCRGSPGDWGDAIAVRVPVAVDGLYVHRHMGNRLGPIDKHTRTVAMRHGGHLLHWNYGS